jgi:hypothetical protein
MAKKKKSRIKDVVETVESWVGMGPKAKKKTAKAPAPKAKTAKKTKKKSAAPKKGKKAVKKKK